MPLVRFAVLTPRRHPSSHVLAHVGREQALWLTIMPIPGEVTGLLAALFSTSGLKLERDLLLLDLLLERP